MDQYKHNQIYQQIEVCVRVVAFSNKNCNDPLAI